MRQVNLSERELQNIMWSLEKHKHDIENNSYARDKKEWISFVDTLHDKIKTEWISEIER